MNSRISVLALAVSHGIAVIYLSSCSISPKIRSTETIVYSSGIQETKSEITGNVVFKKGLGRQYDIIHEYKEDPFGITWWLASGTYPSQFDTPVAWKLEVLEQSGGDRGKRIDVLRFSIQDNTVFDASICNVHHIPMKRVVETRDEFSGRRMPDSFNHASLTQFPNTGTVFPVCTYSANSNITWRCSKCLESSRKWCRKNASNATYL